VLVRDGEHTVLTMGSDFQGDPREFAVVIPVPTPIERGQIRRNFLVKPLALRR